MHGKYRRGPCNYGDNCHVLLCKFLHPAGWWAADRALACPLGARCTEEECSTLKHPKERDAKLRLVQEQREQQAQQAQAVTDAQEVAVLSSAKRGGLKKKDAEINAQFPAPPKKTKSREQREQDRQNAGFTILGCRDAFLQRLFADRIVIITAGNSVIVNSVALLYL